MLPMTEVKPPAVGSRVHPAVFVMSWIILSSVTILFNKYLLSNLAFLVIEILLTINKLDFPAILTCWHMAFATVMTQILARYSTLLDGRKQVKMSGRVYMRAIVPIGVLYSASLVCSNQVYLYLSVAFVQMLKASAPAAVLLISWSFRVAQPSLKVFINIAIIVFGVTLASLGEVKFNWIGFFYQLGGTVSEGVRLIMIQILLSGEGQAMDPLVSLYYYAPVCTVANAVVAICTELAGEKGFVMGDIWRVGISVLTLNAGVAFLLNVASVFLIGKTSGLVMTLCGVLKNILLVVASVVIWGTIISGLQVFGYGIALAGLVYYGVGYNGIMTYWTVTSDFVKGFLEGRVQGASIGTGRGRWIDSKVFWFAVWIIVTGFLLLWIVGRSDSITTTVGDASAKLPPGSSHD